MKQSTPGIREFQTQSQVHQEAERSADEEEKLKKLGTAVTNLLENEVGCSFISPRFHERVKGLKRFFEDLVDGLPALHHVEAATYAQMAVDNIIEVLELNGVAINEPDMFSDGSTSHGELTVNPKWIKWFTGKSIKEFTEEDVAPLVIRVKEEVASEILGTEFAPMYKVSVLTHVTNNTCDVKIEQNATEVLKDQIVKYMSRPK